MSFKRKLKRKARLNEIKTYVCTKCGKNLSYHNGKIVCKHCGQEYENRVMEDTDE